MFTATNYRIAFALTICLVVSAEAQRGEQQRGCLTPREAFQQNEPGAKLCPPQSKPTTTPGNNAPRGSTNPVATNPGATTQTAAPAAESKTPPVAPVSLPPSLPPLVLKYSFLRVSSTGDLVPVKVATEFRTGDRIKLNVESNEQAYLYILAIGPSGKQTSLFPDERMDGGQNLVPAHRTYQVPAGGAFVFMPPPGQEKLFIIVSRRPIEDADKKLRDSRETSSPVQLVNNIDVGAIRGKARDLEFESADVESYVANGNGATDDLVWVDLVLNHR
jgi:hypothetical protein